MVPAITDLEEKTASRRTNRSGSSISTATSGQAVLSESESQPAETSAPTTLKKPHSSLTAAAPQLKIADDGTIVINEESLVIERESEEPVYDATVVESEHNDKLTYSSYRRFHHSKKWNEKETVRFYKALGMVGTDFTMIQKFFQHRSRNEVKRKFKREEKLNQALIDKILSETKQIDLSAFVSSSEEEKEVKKKGRKKKVDDVDTVLKKKEARELKTKQKKLKRVRKRDLVGSESDVDAKKSPATDANRKQVKSKEFITDTECSSTEEDEVVENVKRESPAKKPNHVVCRPRIPSPQPPFSSQCPEKEKQEDDDEDEEEEDGIELVFDMDKNVVNVVKENESTVKATTATTESTTDDSDDEEGEGHLILDLDTKTFIRNTPSAVSSPPPPPADPTSKTSSLSNSKITITKVPR
jgi:hypothetical protein